MLKINQTTWLALAWLLSLCPLNAQIDEDWRLWADLYVVAYDDAHWQAAVLAEGRFLDSIDYLGTYLLNPWVTWKAHQYFDLGLSYTWCDARPNEQANYNRLHRGGAFIEPKFALTDDLFFSARQKLEIWWLESNGDKPFYVSRHRTRLRWKTDFAWLERLNYLQATNELFYHYDFDMFYQNRFTPLEASFRIDDGIDLNVYGMMRGLRSPANRDWQTAYVLGAALTINLPALLD